MSLRGEMNDFLKAYTSVSGVLQKQNDSAVKSKYYDALIDQGKQKIGLQQQSLALRAQQLRNSNSIAGGRLGEMRRHNQAMEGIAGQRIKSTLDPFADPEVQNAGKSGYFDSNPTSAVPVGSTSPATAAPGTPDTSSPDNVSLSNPEGQAYAQSDNEDEDDEEDMVSGGVVKGYAGGGFVNPWTTYHPQAAPAAAPAPRAVPTAPMPKPMPQAAASPGRVDPIRAMAYGIIASNPAIQKLNNGQIPAYDSPMFGAEGGEVPDEDKKKASAVDANESAYDTGKSAERDVGTDANASAYDTGKSAERSPETPKESPYQNPTEDANSAAYDEGGPKRSKEDSGYLQGSGKGAVDTEEAPEGGEPTAAPEPTGTATKASTGFDQAKVLHSWGIDPETNPIHLGLTAISDGERAKSTGAVPAGGAPTPIGHGIEPATREDTRMIDHIVDPQHELAKSSLHIARLDAITKFYLNHGDVQKAQKIAGSLIVSAGLDAQMYGDAALKAIQSGHTEAAVDMIKHAYDQVPDGHELNARVMPDGRVHAVDRDTASGEEKDLGTFGPQQVLQLAKGIANGSEYWNRMVQFGSGLRGVGQQQQKPQKPQYGPTKIADREKEDEAITKAATPAGGEKLPPDQTAPQGHDVAINGIARQLLHYNEMMGPEARQLAIGLSDPNLPKGTIQPQQDGSAIVQHNGNPVKIPPNALGQIMTLQGMRSKEKQASDQQAAEKKTVEDTRNAKLKAVDDEAAADHSPERIEERNKRAREAQPDWAGMVKGAYEGAKSLAKKATSHAIKPEEMVGP